MQYMGGKSRISKDISSIINKFSSNDRDFVSLFCGSCAIESQVLGFKRKLINDKHQYLIAMFKRLQQGWQPPNEVSKEQYYEVKTNMNEDIALSGFIGFACSFGGKWWGGYAKNNSGTNYAKQGVNSLNRKIENLKQKDTIFYNLDYRDIPINPNSIVYADPPYKDTTKYSNSSGFNHEEFWEYITRISKNSLVFISELTAPKDFVSVWQKPLKRNLDKNKDNLFSSQEHLFIHKDNLDLFNQYINNN